jgi:hypothetical protein
MNIKVPISPGELVDKVSILKIKSERIKDPKKLKNVNHELNILLELMKDKLDLTLDSDMFTSMYLVNLEIWDIEDKIRMKERDVVFDSEFIRLARSVYITNDRRATIKKCIDITFKSKIGEEKSYEKY